ncbi:MAG: aminotransferase class V-fold PLP-dependent enzyme [Erythrobacter sp.]
MKILDNERDAANQTFERFGQSVDALIAGGQLEQAVVGHDICVEGPFGSHRLVYADHAASGRALKQVEEFIITNVLPYYANPHSRASFCGRRINALRGEARRRVAQACGADDRYDVIFAGAGATAGIQKLVHLFELSGRSDFRSENPPLIIVGPYEHHSNLLPWRESGAETIELPESEACSGPCPQALERILQEAGSRKVVCSFSAGSNVTGSLVDIEAITRLAKGYGALVVWDNAGAGPYLPIAMAPSSDASIDAVVVSPHKMLGGPGATGVLIVRREAVAIDRPTASGGGTVRYVTAADHDYSLDLATREEAGTPNTIGDIRAALAFEVKEALSRAGCSAIGRTFASKARSQWSAHANLHMLGPCSGDRLPIIAFRMTGKHGQLVHHQLITQLLSDRYGIQTRGGCACAGPYVHRLLSIDDDGAQSLRRAVLAGDEMAKPGFVRLSFSSCMSEETASYIIEAVSEVAKHIDELAALYRHDENEAIFEYCGETCAVA